MNNKFFSYIFYFLMVSSFLFFVSLIAYKLIEQPRLTPSDVKISFFPSDGNFLLPNKTVTFIVSFNKGVNFDDYDIKLYSENITQDTQATRLVEVNKLRSGNSLEIKTTKPVTENGKYTIEIKNKNGSILFSNFYLTGDSPPTPAPTNNKELIPFLPYKTVNFSLEYSRELNKYVFTFIYDPSSDLDIETQYNNAQKKALDFIKSKNINPSSLVIEWKHG